MAQAKFPFYDQLAFDFYRTTVLDSFPVKKKITIYRYISDLHFTENCFTMPNCNENSRPIKTSGLGIWKEYDESMNNFDAIMIELNTDSINKKQFRIKEMVGNYHPKLLIGSPLINESSPERVFLNIREEHSETLTIIYSLEFNTDGKVVNWCRTEHQIFIEY
jgi:hypothetical protein